MNLPRFLLPENYKVHFQNQFLKYLILDYSKTRLSWLLGYFVWSIKSKHTGIIIVRYYIVNTHY